MIKRHLIVSLVAAALILAGAGCIAKQAADKNQPVGPIDRATVPAEAPNTPLLGGDRDEHGCIGSAGYSWCESKKKCLRIWEEECTGMEVNAPEQPTSTVPEPSEVPGAADEGGVKADNGDNVCTSSGGTVGSAMCCLSANDFPNSCLIGSCGCSPANSHAVKTCECGEGRCFDGKSCVGR